jgi:hypothetical protein
MLKTNENLLLVYAYTYPAPCQQLGDLEDQPIAPLIFS